MGRIKFVQGTTSLAGFGDGHYFKLAFFYTKGASKEQVAKGFEACWRYMNRPARGGKRKKS